MINIQRTPNMAERWLCVDYAVTFRNTQQQGKRRKSSNSSRPIVYFHPGIFLVAFQTRKSPLSHQTFSWKHLSLYNIFRDRPTTTHPPSSVGLIKRRWMCSRTNGKRLDTTARACAKCNLESQRDIYHPRLIKRIMCGTARGTEIRIRKSFFYCWNMQNPNSLMIIINYYYFHAREWIAHHEYRTDDLTGWWDEEGVAEGLSNLHLMESQDRSNALLTFAEYIITGTSSPTPSRARYHANWPPENISPIPSQGNHYSHYSGKGVE